ncbi:hypothetical protein [Microbacterium sp. BR1]|uniref:hypothetical protein n=1 Tax=Microbacterium sp. BR1 TaxID=1070896 RepID=UPI0012FDE101|nr:hypothetical protein [Microbacterium sp. BR1]
MENTRPGQPKTALLDLLNLPATINVPTAGRIGWGLSRARSYELAAQDAFPCPVVKLGERFFVRSSDLLRSLGIDVELALVTAQDRSVAAARDSE